MIREPIGLLHHLLYLFLITIWNLIKVVTIVASFKMSATTTTTTATTTTTTVVVTTTRTVAAAAAAAVFWMFADGFPLIREKHSDYDTRYVLMAEEELILLFFPNYQHILTSECSLHSHAYY